MRSSKQFFYLMVVLAVVAIGLMGCGTKNVVTPNPQVNTPTETDEQAPMIDEKIVQIISGDIPLSETEVAVIHYPQLVGDTEDIKKVNEEVKDLYFQVEEKNLSLSKGGPDPLSIGFGYDENDGNLTFKIEYELESGNKITKTYQFSSDRNLVEKIDN